MTVMFILLLLTVLPSCALADFSTVLYFNTQKLTKMGLRVAVALALIHDGYTTVRLPSYLAVPRMNPASTYS